MRRNNGGALPSTTHGNNPREEFGEDLGSKNQGRREGYLQGLLSLSTDWSSLFSGGVPREDPYTRQDPVKLYVPTLEG